ncbi:MAG: recombinase RecT [Melioribacteraceae bacterium]|nr:recombinase RecT [Melioribacteraceae bacterium]
MELTKKLTAKEIQELRKEDQVQYWYEIEGGRKKLQTALGPNIDVNKYFRGIITTILTERRRNDGRMIINCTADSIVKCILISAQLGLEVDFKQHAFLIPRKNKDILECTFMPGYRGYLYKLRSSKDIASICVEPVFDGDYFKVVKGTDPKIEHEPNLTLDNKQDNITHFYAVVTFTNGSFEFEVMSKHQIEKVRASAKTQDIWGPHFQEMGRKTVLLRLVKRLQMPETHTMSAIDNATHQGEVVDYSENQITFTREQQQIDHNPNADHSMPEEKIAIIAEINNMFDILGANEGQKLATINRWCMVPKLEQAKMKNLDMLRKMLNSDIDQMNQKGVQK